MKKGLCFVISQIGKDDSEERKQADALLDVVETCCELHSLECVRADKIKGSTDINEDIIEHIRNADLCIIDLTNLNPNVMYEFGIRFETGRPYIVLAHKDTNLPFDTITRRTIFYDDLQLATECKRVQKNIREYINIFESKEFSSLSNTPSLANIYGLLEKIDSKLDGVAMLSTMPSSILNSTPADISNVEELLNSLDPSEAFHYAYKTNQISLAEELLKLLKGTQPDEYYLNKLCALCSRGSVYAAAELEQDIEKMIASDGKEKVLEVIGCLVSNYNRRNTEKEKIDFMENVFEIALSKMRTNKEKAAVLNQKQRLWAGAGRYEEAKNITENVLTLNDEEPAYFFNYATILDVLEDEDKAVEAIKDMVALKTEDDDHLFLACTLLKKSKKDEDKILYQECLDKLEKVNPYKARMIHFR